MAGSMGVGVDICGPSDSHLQFSERLFGYWKFLIKFGFIFGELMQRLCLNGKLLTKKCLIYWSAWPM